jgi:hypothetical protein
LERYAEQRKKDHDTVINFTDSVVKQRHSLVLSATRPAALPP